MPTDPPDTVRGPTIPVTLLPTDTGPAGHISNVGSLRVIDAARQVFLGTRATAPAGLLGPVTAEVGHVIRAQTLDYRAEYWHSPEPVRVALEVTGVGRTSFRLAAAVTTPEGGPPVVVGEATYVLVDRASGAPWPISDELRRELARHAAQG